MFELNSVFADVVYIGSIHPRHRDNCVAMLSAGKPVLCEKPLAVNLKQVKHMTDTARQKQCLLMEVNQTKKDTSLEAPKITVDDSVYIYNSNCKQTSIQPG